MKIEAFIILYLQNNPSKVPSIKFWFIALLYIRAGVTLEIQMEECDDPHELTVEDCFNEIGDLWEEDSSNNTFGGVK